jgi:hypothetical protein
LYELIFPFIRILVVETPEPQSSASTELSPVIPAAEVLASQTAILASGVAPPDDLPFPFMRILVVDPPEPQVSTSTELSPVIPVAEVLASQTAILASGVAPPDPEPLSSTTLFGWNLAVILGSGVLISGWLLRFTDWFESVATLLALSGLFTWLAFVMKVLPKEDLEGLNRRLAENVFKSPRTWKVTLGLLGVLLFLSLFCGTVQIEAGKGAVDARVKVYPADSKEPPDADSEPLPAVGRKRFVCCLLYGPWVARNHQIRVSGLPGKQVRVRPWLWTWTPEKLLAPGDFLRPVVLVVPDPVLVKHAIDRPKDKLWIMIRITHPIDGKTDELERVFDGHPIWLSTILSSEEWAELSDAIPICRLAE